jgi:hypothetical protein
MLQCESPVVAVCYSCWAPCMEGSGTTSVEGRKSREAWGERRGPALLQDWFCKAVGPKILL